MGGQVDLVVYSLASPVRKLPDTGEVKRSALKPIGQTYTATAIDTNKDTVIQASIEPATEQEIADTVTVMGGQDRSEEHTSELQSLMRISYAVFCLKKKTHTDTCTPNKNKQKAKHGTHYKQTT